MKIVVNGETIAIDQPCNVQQLLGRYQLGTAVCAVEVNRQLVPRKQHEGRVLQDGDCVEIVTLVGGG